MSEPTTSASVAEPPHDLPATHHAIVSIEIAAFRGITLPLDIDLPPSSEQGASLLLLGDNGSGKSSIVDAIQFALQCELRGVRGRAAAAAAKSYGTDLLPDVAVTFRNGESVRRRVTRDEGDDRLVVDARPVDGFARTPLVVRRADILRFWDTPPETRQLVFLRYFAPGTAAAIELPHERIARLNAERANIKAIRRTRVQELAKLAGRPAVEIPTTLGDFDQWVTSRLRGGYDAAKRRPRKQLGANVFSNVKAVRESLAEIQRIDRELKRPVPTQKGDELRQVLTEASGDVTDAFRAISPLAPVTAITLSFGATASASLDITATLTNGRIVDPGHVLSEANRDLVALLIFIAVAQAAARRGTAEFIALDDVFQSIDAPIRVAAVDYLLTRLGGWQFLFATHDRLWWEQLRGLMLRHSCPLVAIAITDWTLENGPVLRSVTSGGSTHRTEKAIASGDPISIALHAGRLLEEISDVLSVPFEMRITRRRGDRYTLGDLWPPLLKALKKTSSAAVAEEIDRYIHLRNLLGAHANAWAETASLTETRRFGQAVLALHRVTYCDMCSAWIAKSPQRGLYVCRCGSRSLGTPA